MKDVRITVVDNTFNKKIAALYGVSELSACPNHKVGQTFVSKSCIKPDGLCEEAWTCFEKYVFALSRGAENLWPYWVNDGKISVNTCNDGFRPTVFLLEAIDE